MTWMEWEAPIMKTLTSAVAKVRHLRVAVVIINGAKK